MTTDIDALFDAYLSAEPMAALRIKIMGMERPYNWNHRNARAVTKNDCEAAIVFLRSALEEGVPHPDFVSPSPRGKVALSWRIGANLAYAEVSAKENGRLYFQWGGPTDGAKEGMTSYKDFIKRLLRLATRGQGRHEQCRKVPGAEGKS